MSDKTWFDSKMIEALESDRDRLAAELAKSKRQIEILEAAVDWKNHVNEAMVSNLKSVRDDLAAAVEVLRKIAAPISCGCKPCTGDCTSESAAKIILEEIQSESRAFLARMEVRP